MKMYTSTISSASTTVISQSMNGFSMLIPLASVIAFGVFGGIAYSLTGAFAFLLFAFVSKRVKIMQNHETSLSGFLQRKLSKRGYRLMVVILMLNSIAVMSMQEIAGIMILKALFGIPFSFAEVLCVLILIALMSYRRIKRQGRLPFLMVTLYFTTAILLPLYFFLTQGVSQIYDGISLYHPYLLVTSYSDISSFILVTTLISLGQLLLQTVFWRQVFSLDQDKIKETFSISGIVWGTLSLAFSTLVWVMIYTGSFENMQSIVNDILQKIHSSSLLGLFLLCLSSSVTSSFITELQSLMDLWNSILDHGGHTRTWIRKSVPLTGTLFLSLGSFFVLFYIQPSLTDVLLFFGIVYAAAVPPTLAIVLARGAQNDLVPSVALLSIIVGFSLTPLVGYLNAVTISATISVVMLLAARRLKPSVLQISWFNKW